MAPPADPAQLTLLRSDQLRRQRCADHLLADVGTLRDSTAALRERADRLRDQLEHAPADTAVDASYRVLASEAVSRQVGVWAVKASGRSVVVRLRPHPDSPLYMAQIEQADDGVTVPIHHLPPGFDLAPVLQLHNRHMPDQMAAVVHALAVRVDAYWNRSSQVDRLRQKVTPKRYSVSHDPACCRVHLRLKVSSPESGRVQVELQLLYSPASTRPHECRVTESASLQRHQLDELADALAVFRDQPLYEAFAEAFM